jgi:hypothetical protein
MGDRISISFVKDVMEEYQEESVALFSHWDGLDFLTNVKEYLTQLKEIIGDKKIMEPLDRLEPNTVMVDFIRWNFKSKNVIKSNYYLGRDRNDGDNSDNGHYVVNLDHLWDCDKLDDLFENQL